MHWYYRTRTKPVEDGKPASLGGEDVTPYAKIQVGNYLQYNPIMDKMVVVPISDRPNYTIIHIRKYGILKKRTEVTIEKL